MKSKQVAIFYFFFRFFIFGYNIYSLRQRKFSLGRLPQTILRMNVRQEALLAACAGLFTQRMASGIPEVSTTNAITAYIAGNCILGVALKAYGQYGAYGTALQIFTINSSYLSSLVLSTLIYRVYFHPLKSFPGSRLASLSKLYEAFLNWHGRNGSVVRDLHRQHGDFIRTGPNELAINNAEAVEIIWARTQPSGRGPQYAAGKLQGGESLISTRDREVHASWKRIWLGSFRFPPAAMHDLGRN